MIYWRYQVLTPEASQIAEEIPKIQRVDVFDCGAGVSTPGKLHFERTKRGILSKRDILAKYFIPLARAELLFHGWSRREGNLLPMSKHVSVPQG